MGKIKSSTHQEKVEGLISLIKLTGLTPLGFSELLQYKSEGKYIYSIINGNKPFSKSFQNKIIDAFGFESDTFDKKHISFDLKKIRKAINKFAHENPDNLKYFVEEEEVIKVLKQLIREGFFSEKRTVSEIRVQCDALGYSYTSDYLTNKLLNLVYQKRLSSQKQIVVKKDGTEGTRNVNVYWEP